jgi:hypothetical protein
MKKIVSWDDRSAGFGVSTVGKPRCTPGSGFDEDVDAGGGQPADHFRNHRHPTLAGCGLGDDTDGERAHD